MSSKDAAVEVALLEIAKDLLQASDDLAASDPSASAKLAHEAYEIGRDLGIVRNHLEPPQAEVPRTSNGSQAVSQRANGYHQTGANGHNGSVNGHAGNAGHNDGTPKRVAEEEGDDDLFRILDRQREVVPSFSELAPVRSPSRQNKDATFEVSSPAPKRSSWFSWMRSRDLHHAG